jgi:glutamyl-tRNA reductase
MNIPNSSYNQTLNSFCIAGINYRKSDMKIRGKFSLSPEQSVLLLKNAAERNISGCLPLSTCNRTEIYGICNQPKVLAEMLCTFSESTIDDFLDHGYIYQGLEAIEHLFKVASGLDSQIIGYYEILSQL